MAEKSGSYHVRDRIIFWSLGITVIILIQGISNFWLRTGGVTLFALVILYLSEQLLTDRRRLLKVATMDELTKLGNFRAFQDRMYIETQRFLRKSSQVTLILIDLDQFKKYNDTYGHRRGNELLQMCGLTFRESVRIGDEVYRFGGDEFAVILPDTDVDDARRVAVRIRQAFLKLDIRDSVTISMGMAAYQGESIQEFFDRVDNILYTVKLQGGNCCQVDSTVGYLSKKLPISSVV